MTAILGRTGNLVGFSTGRGTTPWDTEMEAALRKMDAMLASTVVAITNTLPGSANEGDLFLVGTLPTGVAAGWANRIARWRGSPAGWEAYQPMQGWIVTVTGEATDKVRRFNGTSWTPIGADVSVSSIPTLSSTLTSKLDANNPVATGTLTVQKVKLSDAGAGIGELSWSTTEHVAEITLENGSVLQVGKESLQWCKNETGATISNGKLVYVSSSTGDNPVIALASFASPATSETIGMTTQTIANGQHGYVAVGVSFVRNLVTSGGTPGTAIYLTTAGNYSTTPPVKPGRKIRVGFILREHATAGIVLLWITSNPSLVDINDVDSTSAVTDDVLRRNASGVWVPGKALPVNNPTANGAVSQAWSSEYKPVAFGLGASTAVKNWPDGDTLYLFNNVYRASGDVSKAISGTGNCSIVLIGADGRFTYQTAGNPGAGESVNPAEKFSVDANGALWLNGTPRVTAGGDGRFVGLRASEIAGPGIRPLVALSDGTIDDQAAPTFLGTIGAAQAPARATISASTSLGGVSASAIYIPASDVNLTLTGGVDGQGWDIYSTSGFGLAVPSGTTLYAYSGSDIGPTTRNPGGGRAVRVVRLTATIWLVPNMSW